MTERNVQCPACVRSDFSEPLFLFRVAPCFPADFIHRKQCQKIGVAITAAPILLQGLSDFAAGRNVAIDSQQFYAVFVLSAEQHTFGELSCHLTGREIGDHDDGLANQFFG